MMETLTDLILRYCIIFGKRFSIKDKVAFLRVITKELIQLGYNVDTKVAKLALSKKKNHNFYNAYIGDIEKAELIICTYYDTTVIDFNLLKTYAFRQQFSKIGYFIGLLPIIIVFLLSIILNYFIFIPNIQIEGFFSISGISSVLSTVLLFCVILKFKNGIPNKNNFVCNSSSIITIVNLIKKLDKKTKKKIAFVLLDAGCNNQYGLKMLESYSESMKDKKFIFLDSVGNDEQLLFFKPTESNIIIDDLEVYQENIDTVLKNYLLVTAGHLDNNNQVLIKNAHSRKDNQLSPELIEKQTQALYKISLSILDN